MKNRVLNNAMWIIACRIGQAILQLIVSMFTARYLGPSNFGLINYAMSVIAFVTPIVGLGMNGILVQEIVSAPDKEGEKIGTAIISSCISAFLCVIGVLTFVYIANRSEKDTIIVCFLYSGILFFQAIELVQYWFQAKLLSKYMSVCMLIGYAVSALYQIYILIAEKGIYWFAVSKVIEVMVIDVLLIYWYRKLGAGSMFFSYKTFTSMFAKSKYYIISNFMVVVFAETDKIMIKLMKGDTSTGYYTAAVACAAMTNFVFSAILDSFRPIIFDSKKKDDQSFRNNVMKLYSIIIYLSFAQCICMVILARLVVFILYGAAYFPAVSVLRIVVWYTIFSYIGSVRNIWLLAEGKQKSLVKINCIGAFTNVVLNLVLIPILDIEGAALASFITQFFTNVVTGYIFKELRENNEIMLQGLKPSILIGMIKQLLLRE